MPNRQGADRAVHTVAQGRPRVPVPFRDMVRAFNYTGARELSPGIDVAVLLQRNGSHRTVHTVI